MKKDKDHPITLDVIKAMTKLCEEQAVMATMFHETWAPTVKDSSLIARMGTSYATQSFHIVAWALRRELILALMRLWDTRSDTTNLIRIRTWVSEEENYAVLLNDRAERLSAKPHTVAGLLRDSLDPIRMRVVEGIGHYLEGGKKWPTFKCLQILRNKRLAHRDLETPPDAVDPTDDQVVQFYLDTLAVVTDLLHLVSAESFDLEGEAARVYRHHARYFWAAARGERTEGHPDFRGAPL
jgi:hypothetical protein